MLLLPLTRHGRPKGRCELVNYAVLAFFIMFPNEVCLAVGRHELSGAVHQRDRLYLPLLAVDEYTDIGGGFFRVH